MDSKVIIQDVRFSYVHLFDKDSNDKYSVSLIIAKNNPQIADIKKAIQEAVKAGAAKLGTNFKLDLGKVLHDGDIDKLDDEAYANSYYLNAKSSKPVGIVKKNETGMGGKVMSITDQSEFYSGCYGAASVSFFAFNSGTNKGIGVGLNNVLKLRDGDILGGGSSAANDFDELLGSTEEDVF